jgi:hypothetical protein
LNCLAVVDEVMVIAVLLTLFGFAGFATLPGIEELWSLISNRMTIA